MSVDNPPDSGTRPHGTSTLARIARACVRHRWIVIGSWVAALVVINGVAGAVGPDYRTDFTLPASETKEVQELLEANSPDRAGFTSQIVFRAPQGVDDPEVQATMNELFAYVAGIDDITVTSPYDTPQQISQDGTIAFAQLDIADTRTFTELIAIGDDIIEQGDEINTVEGLQIEYGGDLFAEFELPESEIYGLIAAVIILILAFGSVLAMGLPIGIALFGLGIASALVSLASNVITMPDFTTSMVAMIGLGVGIDYALFIVTRYRENLQARRERRRLGGRVDRHQRPRRAVRRHHGDHRAARPAADRAGVRAGRRDRLGARRGDDDRRLAHPAAGAARLGRHPHRQHHVGGADRRRARRGRRVRRGHHRSERHLPRRLPAGDRVLRHQLRHQAAAPARPAPGREAQGGAGLVPVEPVHPAPARLERAVRRRIPAAAHRPAVLDPSRLRRRRQLPRGHAPSARPTTCSPKGSGRARTARCSSPCRARPRPIPRRSAHSSRRSTASTTSRSACRTRSPTTSRS